MEKQQEFHNLAEAQLNQNSSEPTYWGNLGLWQTAIPPAQQDYAEACSAMARKVADYAQLNEADTVIDIGFGCGDQLLLWLQGYGVEQLYGLNLSHSQTQLSQQRLEQAGFSKQAQQCQQGSSAELLEWAAGSLSASATKIITLDCAYHFKDRQQFLGDSYTLLANNGKLVLCDLLLDDRDISFKNKLVLKTLCRLCNIPYRNLLTQAEYLERCQRLGFTIAECTDLTERVFLPFGEWLQAYQEQHSDKQLRWGKYTGTAWFLRWAKQQGTLHYVIVSLHKR